MIHADLNSFWRGNGSWLTALGTLLLTLVAAKLIDHAIARHAKPVAVKVKRGELSPVAVTRMRLVRRLIFVVIIVIGLSLAIAPFSDLRRIATGLLASSAVLGLVIGFAARQTLANAIAGIMLAVVQPIRVGDVVLWEGTRGTVEDLTLTYTFIRIADGRRLIVPNERIASGPVFNYSIGTQKIDAEAPLWLPTEHAAAALKLLREQLPDCAVAIGEVDRERTQLKATRPVVPEQQAAAVAQLQEQALQLLSRRELLGDPAT